LSARFHLYLCGRIAAEWVILMKKRFFAFLLILTLCVPTAAALEGDKLRAAETLASYGLVQGTPTGYDVDSLCTRAQALVLLGRLGGYTSGGKNPFSDTPAWAQAEVGALHSAGLLKGVYSGSRLHSGEYINADEWSALLLHLCGIDAEAKGAALYARRLGLISREYTSPLSRGDLFEMTCEALTYSWNGATLAQHMGKESAGMRLLSARDVANHCMASVCALTLYPTQIDLEEDTRRVDASAFFITADGVALTNYHSVKDTDVGYATLSTGEVFPVEGLLWGDEEADLALVRISRTTKDGKVTTPAFAPVHMVGAGEVYAGDRVYAIGNPLNLGLTVSEGIIGIPACKTSVSSIPCIVNNADISAGSSGGALFNELGHVVAVTAGGFPDGNGLYLGIPVDSIMTMKISSMKTVPLSKAT